MRAPIERWLTRRWYDGVAPGLGLRALAGFYRGLRAMRPTARIESLPVPVIVVGNFTAGGTGKTPLVIALAQHFASRGILPGIVSRGHGRRSPLPLRVEADTPVEVCGDEPRLMFEKTGVPVLVDGDRVAAARAAIAAGCQVILADDGLQHRRLGRDVEIEVVDGARRYGNGLLIPAGPLRERPRQCDLRVVNGGPAHPGEWPMQLRLVDALSLGEPRTRRPLASFAGAPAAAVAAIGNPERFFTELREVGIAVAGHPFEDHHAFVAGDFEDLQGPILMTEKDAVKCAGLGLRDAWSVPVEAELPLAFFQAIDDKLEQTRGRS